MYPWLTVPMLDMSVRTSHLCLLLAAVVCAGHAAARLRALDPSAWPSAWPRFLALSVAPWIGGHLHFLLNNWRHAAANPPVLLLPWMGLHAGGALIALALTLPLVLRRGQLKWQRVADALVPTTGLGIILARIGCFAEGCCAGRGCDWPWCVSFPRAARVYELHLAQGHIAAEATRSAPVHPLQLYFAGVGILLLLLSYGLQPYRRYDGQVGLVALFVYAVTTALFESLRGDTDARVYWGALPQLQWTALAMAVAAGLGLFVAERRTSVRLPGRALSPAGPARNDTRRRAR